MIYLNHLLPILKGITTLLGNNLPLLVSAVEEASSGAGLGERTLVDY